MSDKAVLVVLDGLNFNAAHDCMGYLNGLIKAGKGFLYALKSELPSLSRPLYECLMTGVTPVESGIYCNKIVRLSRNESIFSLARSQGKVTAASAYHWMSELYNQAPYDQVEDRIVNDNKKNINHGIFYQWDDYPDEAVINDGEFLRRRYSPDFLLIHPMNIDDTGHHFGLDSAQYRNKVRQCDIFLSIHINSWLDDGYQVVVTSDHGMNNDGTHGGILDCERDVPLFVFGNRFTFAPDCQIIQTQICGLICEILRLKHNKPYPQGLLK